MKKQDRYMHIDIIRGLGILLMMLTHILSWHLGTPGISAFWNGIHFVVVGLVFCSAYLYAKSNSSDTIRHRFRWFLKRILRLYVPFICYLCIHYVLWYAFPDWIRGFGIRRSISFVFSSVVLTGGVDIGWLTTLFLQLAILFPFLLRIIRNKSAQKIIISILLIFTTVTTFIRIPVVYTRLSGWIAWSLIGIFGFIYSDLEEKNSTSARLYAVRIMAAATALYALAYTLLSIYGKSVLLTDHKYPPDIFYLSYGVAFTSLLLILQPYVHAIPAFIRRFIAFLSRESYTLFFTHIIILDMVMTRTPGTWVSESIRIISLSVLVTYGISEFRNIFRLKWKTHAAVSGYDA